MGYDSLPANQLPRSFFRGANVLNLFPNNSDHEDVSVGVSGVSDCAVRAYGPVFGIRSFKIDCVVFHVCIVGKLVTQAGIAPAMIWNPIYREPASHLPSYCKFSSCSLSCCVSLSTPLSRNWLSHHIVSRLLSLCPLLLL